VPELETSVFVIPRTFVKNGLDRYVVLNRIAKSVIEGWRGEHVEFVFTRAGRPIARERWWHVFYELADAPMCSARR